MLVEQDYSVSMEVWLTYCFYFIVQCMIMSDEQYLQYLLVRQCEAAIAREDHHTVLELLPRLRGHNYITCKHPSYGYTAPLLHCTAYIGWLDITKLLITTYKCDPTKKDSSWGYTALHDSADRGHLDVVQYFVKGCGCDVNDRSNGGYTPLHVAAREGHLDVVQYLVEDCGCDVNVRSNDGSTPLHGAAECGHLDVVQYLVAHGADVMATDKYGATPLHHACQYNSNNRNISVIKYLLSIPDVLNSFANKDGNYSSSLFDAEGDSAAIYDKFKRVRISHPVGSFVNIFLLGDTGAGKTSLCHVLKEKAGWFRRMFQGRLVEGVKTHTAGIVPNKFHDKSLGSVIVHDFAGQPEYYSSHTAVLETLLRSSGAVFVVVINLTRDLSQQVRFWLSVVRNECQKAVLSECHLKIVASHADVVKFDEKFQMKMELADAGHSDVPIFPLDCRLRSSNNLDSFVESLSHSCTSVRNKQSPAISLYCNFLYSILEAKVSKDNVCTLEKLMSLCDLSRREGVPLPDDIVPLLKTLHSSGLVVYLENKEDPAKSWIVVRKKILLAEVGGVLFAPEYFKEHRKIASNTGIITSRALEMVFSHDPNMLIAFLQSMKLCETLDTRLLKVTNLTLIREDSLHVSDQLLFFPSLIAEERPQSVEGVFEMGWCLKIASGHSFSVRFLHLLLLNLAYQYSKAVSERKPLVPHTLERQCSVWKNGIQWNNDDGIKTLVELTKDYQCVMMLMCCQEGAKEKMVKLHLELTKAITDLQEEYCPMLGCKDYLLAPCELQYPMERPSDLTRYDMERLLDRIIQDEALILCETKPDKEAAKITELLPIEPKKYLKLYKVS